MVEQAYVNCGLGRVDLHMIFPPQWSPHQPFLSTPSLKAYLEGKGYRVVQSDWNVDFYQYFIREERVPLAQQRLRRHVYTLSGDYEAYKARSAFSLAILEEHSALHMKVEGLRNKATFMDIAHFKESIEAFERLLYAFSTAEPVAKMGLASFSADGVLTSLASLHQFVSSRIKNPFIDFFEKKVSQVAAPRYFGVSIIGQEQILPGLTLCRTLKKHLPEVPIIIGGSVFARLLDKDPMVRELFDVYFDYICRYEGEQPTDAFLSSDNPRAEQPPNLAFLKNGEIIKTPLCVPLTMDKIPTPDFSGLPLDNYLTAEVVLPLLTTRGCYWDKCAFCYHGMVYQNRYRMRPPELIAKDVTDLHKRYGVRHFAFNDEALPPKLFRLLPDVIPPNKFFFTGLYKFEKVFNALDFQRMYDIGFRSLYIGLESASERIQQHMKKDNLQSTMVKNLRNGHNAGIWNHTFVFFGFPTETEEEAEETIQFLLEHADIVHSEGTGTFQFEHNAPISYDPLAFGVSDAYERPNTILELFYDYKVTSGLDADGAEKMVKRFEALKEKLGLYKIGDWIPREHLLILLSYHGRDNLRQKLTLVEGNEAVFSDQLNALHWFTVVGNGSGEAKHFIVNRLTGKVFEVNEDAVTLLDSLNPFMSISRIVEVFPSLAPVAVGAGGG